MLELLWPCVYPQVTCCNLCRDDIPRARSGTQSNQIPGNAYEVKYMECFYATRLENMNVEGGYGVHVAVRCDLVL